MPQFTKPRDGAIRVNDAEYDGIVIEMFGFWQSGEGWAVPAWEEMGRADLAGPFSNHAAAQRAILGAI